MKSAIDEFKLHLEAFKERMALTESDSSHSRRSVALIQHNFDLVQEGQTEFRSQINNDILELKMDVHKSQKAHTKKMNFMQEEQAIIKSQSEDVQRQAEDVN
mmetsp:Transcript_36224/g.55635  ORF Transcript_36224/g.55635 Transcript_36224/m.55635 type:complete len:102 (+) Transcript_36224:39-344(+)